MKPKDLNQMAALVQHKQMLARKNYDIQINDSSRISKDELKLLARYGYWLEALASGIIVPLTPEQSQFVEVILGTGYPSTVFELAWCKLKSAREREREHKEQEREHEERRYQPCPACHKSRTLEGVVCTSCRLKSGDIAKELPCPVCNKTTTPNGGICSNCNYKSNFIRIFYRRNSKPE